MNARSKQITWVFIVVIIVGLLTLPLAIINYGVDADTVRGVKSAEDFLRTGVYIPSRLPGNPLFEYLLVLVVPWGHNLGSNLLVFAFYILSVYVFWLLAQEHSVIVQKRIPLLLTSIYALTPIILVNSVTTLDYVPGLALMLVSYLFTMRRRPNLAAVSLAFSIGFRLSNILFLIPMAIFLMATRRGLRQTITAASVATVGGTLFYIPIFLRFGTAMFIIPPAAYSSFSDYVVRTAYEGILLFGPAALATVAFLSLRAWKKGAASSFVKSNPRFELATFISELLAVGVFTLLFLRHSDATAYLIPIIPFVYFLVATWLERVPLLLVGVAVISFGLFTVEFKGGESGKRIPVVRPAWGLVVSDYQSRTETEDLRRGIGRFSPPTKSVVVTGLGAILTYQNSALSPADYKDISPNIVYGESTDPSDLYRIDGKPVFLVYALSRENNALLQKEGYEVYMFSEDAPSLLLHKYGYDGFENGMRRLVVRSSDAFYKVDGGASPPE